MRSFLFQATALCALGLATAATSAHAQSIDYGIMQDMFGEAVTTSANGSPQRSSDVPLDMTIITSEEIARYPAREIPDILRHYAGISVHQNTSSEYSVGIRGYNTASNERILVLVNGRQVFEDYFGLVNWSAIPVELNEIRQIEIVRGPNTALFGFNATSGVVNIITMNPLHDDIDVLEASTGLNGYMNASGVYTFQNGDDFGLRLSAGGFTADEDENNTHASVTSLHDAAHARNYNADLSLQLNKNTQLRIEASHAITDENILDPYDAGYGRDSENMGIRSNLSSDTEYGIIEANIYRNAIEACYNGATNDFFFENDVFVAQLSDTFKIGTSHTLRIAGEYRNNATNHHVSGTFLGKNTLNIKSASGLWYWNVTNKLSTSIATRYDHVQADYDVGPLGLFASPYSNDDFNNRYDEFGYNLGAVYKLTDIDTLRLTASKGVDLPSSFELGVLGAGAVSYYADPNTEASNVHDFQLGYERHMADINGALKIAVFYQRINEQQGFIAQSSTLGITGNIGDSQVYGLELGLKGLTDNHIRWGMTYSFSTIEDDINAGSRVNYKDSNSEHIVNANIGYAPNEQWAFDAYASYQSQFDSHVDTSTTTTEAVRIDPDLVLDARIAYKPFEKMTLSLNGQALFGDNEQSAYGEDVDRQIFLRAKYEF
tara:strand:- start:161459 stop:163438 length:1980 start_codon:yes stop_codon:yes gene_type:complete